MVATVVSHSGEVITTNCYTALFTDGLF